MKKNNNSALYNLGQIRAEVRAEANKEIFKTYKKAIEEIGRLQDEIYSLKLANALLTSKPKRGRPKKYIKSSGSFLGNFLFGAEEKKKGGRPAELTREEMIKKIKEWDLVRAELAKEIGKKSILDLEAIYLIIGKSKDHLLIKERQVVEEFHKKIGYYRDQTGVRIRTNIKRKTPAKKT